MHVLELNVLFSFYLLCFLFSQAFLSVICHVLLWFRSAITTEIEHRRKRTNILDHGHLVVRQRHGALTKREKIIKQEGSRPGLA